MPPEEDNNDETNTTETAATSTKGKNTAKSGTESLTMDLLVEKVTGLAGKFADLSAAFKKLSADMDAKIKIFDELEGKMKAENKDLKERVTLLEKEAEDGEQDVRGASSTDKKPLKGFLG